MEKLVDRLYDGGVCSLAENYCKNRYVMDEAAHEIERLQEQVAVLREALNHIHALARERNIGLCTYDALRGLVLRMGEFARTAISDTAPAAEAYRQRVRADERERCAQRAEAFAASCFDVDEDEAGAVATAVADAIRNLMEEGPDND